MMLGWNDLQTFYFILYNQEDRNMNTELNKLIFNKVGILLKY